ncbi:MAG: transcription antitermination factor NusB [Chitinophagaceae bacterium]
MISRRNIRVKVMQTLYSLELYNNPTHDGIIPGNVLPSAKKILQQHLEQTTRLFKYLLYNMVEISRYAKTDALQRSSKYLVTPDDLNVNTQIAENKMVVRMTEDLQYAAKADPQNPFNLIDKESIKKLYHKLVQSPEYLSYISDPHPDEKEDKKILLYIFHEIMLKDPDFIQQAEDNFIHWPDDSEMMDMLVVNYLNKPRSFDFNQLISSEKEEYAFELMQTAIEKKKYCMELITPRLQNWDSDRIASIDLLLMIMGICEFLYFPTIPSKVTINEYIDLAKTYSTPQSGQFVNGILDNVLKDLNTAEKIHKTDRIKK